MPGYTPDEQPKYDYCPWKCGLKLRADRIDLIVEHLESCKSTLSDNQKIRLLSKWLKKHTKRKDR